MNRRWLRWIWLLLALEAGRWFLGVSRYCFDFPGVVDRSRPILIRGKYERGILVIQQGKRWLYFPQLTTYAKLNEILNRSASPPGAYRTPEGKLVDTQGRTLLSEIHELSVFAYSPEQELLVWGTPPGENPYGLNIRYQGKERFIPTWDIYALQIRPDGTIWLAESGIDSGVAVLNQKGQFLGWRAFGYPAGSVEQFAEVSDTEMSLMSRLVPGIN